MNLIQRVQDILLKPKETWPQIAQESATTQSIYQQWLMLLAAIPAVASFIGLSLVGMGAFGFSYRVPLVQGLVHMVLSYGLSLLMIYLVALVVDALAPSFGGTRDRLAALKVVAYGSTAGFVGGIFDLLPMLGVLGLLCALYSVYLIYLGLPVLMRNPPEKSIAYTAVVVVVCLVAGLIVGSLTSVLFRGMGAMGSLGGGGTVSLKSPNGEVTLDTSKMEAAAKSMEEAGKRLETAQAKGDNAAAGKALGEIMGAMSGATGGGKPLPAADLKAALPEALGELKRSSIESQSGAAMGIASSSAKARYGDGNKTVAVDITDLGGLAGMAAFAGWANMTVDKESNGQIEKVYKQGDRTVRENYRKDGSLAELTVILPNGIVVEARGQQLGIDQVRGAMAAVDLNKLASAQRPAN